ncbi:MDR family NADP-dependent oxidoreductase [Actinopolyspora mortivallis]|uniref:NADP-dependent oxidoreductase n=1 Tax=Actinopolyspora mortivallis TaxID=33906 RepID=A0A2T0GY25_ACTMO|nr:NADP-dependent oxidoreductase [Actinopolyspora mortivallis]PRW64015.1 NADP-dependent oxidoreductase [Actinopolyspora mortivallis]
MDLEQHSSLPEHHREIRLREYPDGTSVTDALELVETPLPSPGPGQVVVRNEIMKITAAMYTMATASDLPMSSYEPGRPLWGAAVGRVVAAAPDSGVEVGTRLVHEQGWREYALLGNTLLREHPPLPEVSDPAVLLAHGAPAWAALTRLARVRETDTVFVSGAAGGVGSMTGQIARRLGAGRVVGSTGSASKADRLCRELGYDSVVLRGSGSVAERLRDTVPEGVDVVCDTVGGEQLEAALSLARTGARVVLLGALSGQLGGDGLEAPARLDSARLIRRRVEMYGFSLRDHPDAEAEWRNEFTAGLNSGEFGFPHTRAYGLERAPDTLRGLVEGRHFGTVLVEL